MLKCGPQPLPEWEEREVGYKYGSYVRVGIDQGMYATTSTCGIVTSLFILSHVQAYLPGYCTVVMVPTFRYHRKAYRTFVMPTSTFPTFYLCPCMYTCVNSKKLQSKWTYHTRLAAFSYGFKNNLCMIQISGARSMEHVTVTMHPRYHNMWLAIIMIVNTISDAER